MIVQEILHDTNKHFNKDKNYCTNQQLIGHEDLFRGATLKEC